MENINNTPLSAEEASATANLFGGVIAFITSFAVVQIAITLFMQMVLVLTTVLGISLGTAYLLMAVGIVALTIGVSWMFIKLYRLAVNAYTRTAAWVRTKRAGSKKPAAAAPAPAAAEQAAAPVAEAPAAA